MATISEGVLPPRSLDPQLARRPVLGFGQIEQRVGFGRRERGDLGVVLERQNLPPA
jgi:hypothetical protein